MITVYLSYSDKRYSGLCLMIGTLFYMIMVGFRYTLNDYVGYAEKIEEIVIGSDSKKQMEYLYFLFIKLSQYFECAKNAFFCLNAILLILPLFIFMKKYLSRQEAVWVIYFYFVSLFFIDSLNVIRQLAVFILFLNCYSFIRDKCLFKYVVAVVLLCGLHSSAIIYLPLYFVINRTHELSRRQQCIIYLSCFFFSAYFFSYMLEGLSLLFPSLGAFSDNLLLLHYLNSEDSSMFIEKSEELGIARYLHLFTALIIIYFSDFLILKKGELFRIIYRMCFWGLCINCISGGSLFLGRLNYYFYYNIIVILGILVSFLLNSVRPMKQMLAIVLVTLYLGYFFNAVLKGAAGCTPYYLF